MDGGLDHVGPVIRGEPTQVDSTPHIDALQRGHEYIQVHSHPSERTFSLYDVRILCDAPAVRASAVVASGDWWYLMSVAPGDYPAAFREVYEAFVRQREDLLEKYQRYIDEGPMTEDEAVAALDREVWRTIASRLRLVYHEFLVEERT
jgi:proteasome lid subunit RPN8/RPN11